MQERVQREGPQGGQGQGRVRRQEQGWERQQGPRGGAGRPSRGRVGVAGQRSHWVRRPMLQVWASGLWIEVDIDRVGVRGGRAALALGPEASAAGASQA